MCGTKLAAAMHYALYSAAVVVVVLCENTIKATLQQHVC